MVKKVTAVLPVHEFNETVEKYITEALKSVNKDFFDLMIVGPKIVLDKVTNIVKTIGLDDITTFLENEESDFASQINKAAVNCPTKYFTILEFDDMFLPNYHEVMSCEIENGGSVILPINECVTQDGKFLCFCNEIAWDAAFLDDFVEESERDEDYTEDRILGHLTVNQLKVFKDFNVTGGLIKTDDFISVGMLKNSLSIATLFEFLLRIAHNKYVVRVNPRVTYRHTVLRDGAYLKETQKNLKQEEGVALINKALSEYKE